MAVAISGVQRLITAPALPTTHIARYQGSKGQVQALLSLIFARRKGHPATNALDGCASMLRVGSGTTLHAARFTRLSVYHTLLHLQECAGLQGSRVCVLALRYNFLEQPTCSHLQFP